MERLLSRDGAAPIALLLGLGLWALSACGAGDESEEPPAAAPAGVASPVAHGDHSPHHGGQVWMHGDLHFEVVLEPEGTHQVYFTDEIRAELPASVVSDVTIAVLRANAEPEELELEIDEFGESWIGNGEPVSDAEARALVTFRYSGEPYEIEIPFSAEPPDPNAPDPHRMP